MGCAGVALKRVTPIQSQGGKMRRIAIKRKKKTWGEILFIIGMLFIPIVHFLVFFGKHIKLFPSSSCNFWDELY